MESSSGVSLSSSNLKACLLMNEESNIFTSKGEFFSLRFQCARGSNRHYHRHNGRRCRRRCLTVVVQYLRPSSVNVWRCPVFLFLSFQKSVFDFPSPFSFHNEVAGPRLVPQRHAASALPLVALPGRFVFLDLNSAADATATITAAVDGRTD